MSNKNQELDILCFSETFVKQGAENNIKLNNYKLAASFCRETSRGGTCILVQKLLEANAVSIPTGIAIKFFFECCGIEIIGLNTLVFCIYRIPHKGKSQIDLFMHHFEKLLHFVSEKYKRKKIIICGDWNVDTMKDSLATKDLLFTLRNFGFNIHIKTPTRQNSCIDQIASNIKEVKSSLVYLELSDHESAQIIEIKANKQRAITTWFEYKRDFSKENLDKFNKYMASLSFNDVLTSNTVSEAFRNFYDIFCLLYKLCFPLIKVKKNNRPNKIKWLTSGLKKSCKNKRNLYFKYRLAGTNNITNKHRFQQYNRVFKSCLHKAQRIYNNRYIKYNKNKCRATWKTISTTVSNDFNKHEIDALTFENKPYVDPTDICNVLNGYFININGNNTSKKPSVKLSGSLHNTYSIFLKPTNEHEINKILMTLNNTKTAGYDEITTLVLKSCAHIICRPISHVINLSFMEGIFPSELKLSIVKPLFKNGDKTNPDNYRPISIIPILSKVFEKCMMSRMNDFLNKHDILTPKQFGFRKGKSTTLAAFNLVKTVTQALNGKTPITALFLDLSKAFDCVHHSILLKKLETYGIRGKAYDWMESYLTERMQFTEIEKIVWKDNILNKVKYRSNIIVNESGVPQGSILGPLLFLLAINDFPRSVTENCIIFADDTTILITGDGNNLPALASQVNSVLADAINWFDRNNLKINITKTKAIRFCSYNANPLPFQIHYDNLNIDIVDTVTFLGFNIDKNLNWKLHVDKICKKLDRFVYALKRLRQTVSVEAALMAYHGYVSSVLNYGLLLWGNSVDAVRAFKLQKRCLRSLDNAWFLQSCKPLFKKFNILPLPCLYIREACQLVKDNPNHFFTRDEISARHTRDQYQNLLYQPPCRTAVYKKNCYNMCILLYNKLPNDFKIENKTLFKRKLTNWLHEKCFYSIKEFLT